MAPNGHTASGKRGARKSCDAQSASWLDKHGFEEYEAWKEANPDTRLLYDDWKDSNQNNSGLSLYYTTLHIFEESDSSDENGQPAKAKSQPTKQRGQIGRPRKSTTLNGNGPLRSAGTAAPTKATNLEESSPSAKKKRKARKKPLSEEIIASASDSDDAAKDPETSTPGAENATPSARTITITMNGKRKTSTRKARKKPISEETISPEDELDDPMDVTIDEVANSAIASPLPVRPVTNFFAAPKSPATAPTSNPPKKSHILKLSTRKTPKKQETSEEFASGGMGQASASTQATPNTVGKGSQPSITINTNPTPKSNVDPDSAAASPTSTSAPGSTRRGLRTRKPAQQRPYYHDSQLFEDVEPRNGDANDHETTSSPVAQGRRVSIASISKNIDDALLASLDEEAMALLQDEPESEPARPKHFKGKGRAWKKEGSDEDEDYSQAGKKKAAKATKMKVKGQVPKKRGRPRKSGRSEELVGEDTDEDKENVKRKRSMPRKSALSEEIIQDSSDGGEEDREMGNEEEADETKIEPDDKQQDTGEDALEDKQEDMQVDERVDEQEDKPEQNAEEQGVAQVAEQAEEKKAEEEDIIGEEKRLDREETGEKNEENQLIKDETIVAQGENEKVSQEEPDKEKSGDSEEKAEEKVEEKEEKAERNEVHESEQKEETGRTKQEPEKEQESTAPTPSPNRSWTPEGLPEPTLPAISPTNDESTPRAGEAQEMPSPFRKAD
ncbi:hypothetical protein yc1106_00388 [Curvularia clavata]|uniref:Uncharacterized protein n=1 Tax=Curvularia clavata TaxID=95742 RepID=A0A9Q8Z1I7_CURCL|nr:hypothetical protein yc1106_00388 [Curvularia clavata]